MGLVGGVGPASYNGFNFGQNVKSSYATRFEYDAADRTVVCNVYSITLKTVVAVAAGSTTDATILDMEKRLSKPGQILQFAGNGLGIASVNVISPVDSRWGPKPRILKLMPVGNSQAIEVEWMVEVAIPQCNQAVYKRAIMAFNYEVDFSIDNTGLTTRVISGYFEIPMTRLAGSKAVQDTADAYVEEIVPAIPPNFERKEKTRRISMDKRRCDFVFVDVELPNEGGFPPGMVDFEGTHSIGNPDARNTFVWKSNLSASYIVASGQPKALAIQHFFALLIDRKSQATGISTQGQSSMVTSFSASEGLGRNRRITCSAEWIYFCSLGEAIFQSGMFRAVPAVDWSSWIVSDGVRQAAAPRGIAGLKMLPSDDAIVDLCNPQALSILKARGSNSSGESRLRSGGTSRLLGSPQGIQPETSWLRAKIKLVVGANLNQVRLKPLPDKPVPTGGDIGQQAILQGGAPPVGNKQPALNAPLPRPQGIAKAKNNNKLVQQINVTTPDVIQQRCSPSYRVWLVGEAYRAGYTIPLPKLTQAGGATTTPDIQTGEGWVAANWSGVPVYGVRFSLGYMLSEPPDGAAVQFPDNPALFFVG